MDHDFSWWERDVTPGEGELRDGTVKPHCQRRIAALSKSREETKPVTNPVIARVRCSVMNKKK